MVGFVGGLGVFGVMFSCGLCLKFGLVFCVLIGIICCGCWCALDCCCVEFWVWLFAFDV